MCFVHLHNHSEYSLLDGGTRIKDMVSHAKEHGMPAMALTDHGVMFGSMAFYLECQKQGIKPLIGMEAYIAPNGIHKKGGRIDNAYCHLLLLARNEEGYRNLCKLHTVAALHGFYYRPRIDHELLKENARGLISSSTCLGSEICQSLLGRDYPKAQYLAGMYKEIFDEGCFFIELQDHGIPCQKEVNEHLIRIASELQLPLIATNDSHYLTKLDARSHDALLCIGTGSLVSDTKRMRFETEEFYIKTPTEMKEIFSYVPEAIENTLHVADLCQLELGKQKAPMPHPEMPEAFNSSTYLRYLAEAGLLERTNKIDEKRRERLNYELNVIEKTGFEDYFLLVREFAQFARYENITFGVRGSAAGSLVSYSLGITDIDPIEYDITFERFLNIERISMPDIDMDFEDARRDEVIKYVTQKYGKDHVAQIITFGTLGAKAAVRDMGRVMGYTAQETDRICKTIPTLPGMNLNRALEDSADFRALVQNETKVRELVELARSVEGLSRHAGVHAAGIVISGDPLTDHIPLYRGSDGQSITAYEMGILEKIGLLKMDFLGLSNLTVISKAIEYIKQNRGMEIDLQTIPLDNKDTFEMLSRGETVGVFQLESGGMRRCIVELKPINIRELTALIALYRPGPMDHIPRYINNKFGHTPIQILDERMGPILEETYGIIVYQDQVLKLVQAIAGFTLGKADILRRAMGKKDLQAMKDMKVEFMQGTLEKGILADTAEKIWQLLLPFSGYAFNKAHAVSYAFVAYQTAYLKANYPVEYMTALLSVYRSREDKVTNFIEECRKQKIEVLQPDINGSLIDFNIEGKCIRFGLGAIKGIGDGIIQEALHYRENKGFFKNIFDIYEILKPKGINRGSLEALIKSGALDGIETNRKKLLGNVDLIISSMDQYLRNKSMGQDSLFGGKEKGIEDRPNLIHYEAFSRAEKLQAEKEAMGIYVSDHPLRGYERTLLTSGCHTTESICEGEEGTKVVLNGIIANLKKIRTKAKGELMATLVLEDLKGQIACTIFPATYAKYEQWIQKDKIVKINGVLTHRERPGSGGEKKVEVRVHSIEDLILPAELALDQTILLSIPQATRSDLETLKNLLEIYPGIYTVLVYVGGLTLELVKRVNPSEDFIFQFQKIFPLGSTEVNYPIH